MNILGLHFGHDASIALVTNGSVISCWEVERLRGIKHAIGIRACEILDFLDYHNLSADKIDSVAVTTTQGIEYIFDSPNVFSFSYSNSAHDNHLTDWSRDLSTKSLQSSDLEYRLSELSKSPTWSSHPYFRFLGDDSLLEQSQLLGSFETYIDPFSYLDESKSSSSILSPLIPLTNSDFTHGFQYPINVNFFGRQIKGYTYSHHFAHAAYAHFVNPAHPKVIISHDGSLPYSSYRSGAVYYSSGSSISLVSLHHLAVGKMYEVASGFLGFNEDSGAGKMMGLAPYSSPHHLDESYVGNYFSQLSSLTVDRHLHRDWVNNLCESILYHSNSCQASNISCSDIDVISNPLDPRCTLIASSIQSLTQRILSKTCQEACELLQDTVDINKSVLTLTGGTALNCPSNRQVAYDLPSQPIFIPPAVHDAGLSIGSAQHLHYLLSDDSHLLQETSFSSLVSNVYLGISRLSRIDSVISTVQSIASSYPNLSVINDEAIAISSRLLSDDHIIAIFGDRSEIGPRALGSRSILANPTNSNNWSKVNLLKERESWRPFAPIVLSGFEDEYFEIQKNQLSYSYMLVTAHVNSNEIPAVTHKDNSSRVQVLDYADNPTLYNLISSYSEHTGIPVLLNTSFNGPGEPVIETLDRAIQFLSDSMYLKALLVGDSILVVKD